MKQGGSNSQHMIGDLVNPVFLEECLDSGKSNPELQGRLQRRPGTESSMP